MCSNDDDKGSLHGIGFTKSDIPLVYRTKGSDIRESRLKKHYFAIESNLKRASDDTFNFTFYMENVATGAIYIQF